MFHHKYAIAAAITGISVLAAGVPVSASVSSEALREKGIYIITKQASDCNLPEIPDMNLPKPEKPELPAPEKPDNNMPELPAPEKPEQGGEAEIPSFAMQILRLVNQERAKEGLPALQYDAAIGEAALVRAKESELSFSHTRPNGSSFSTALKEQGVSFGNAGENLAWGQKSPEEVMKGWMNSSGHRANILNKNFTKIGVGHYQNGKGVNYWSQLFTN